MIAVKIYTDGEHYIALPETHNPYASKKRKNIDEEIEVYETESECESNETHPIEVVDNAEENPPENVVCDTTEQVDKQTVSKSKKPYKTTKKQLFNDLYSQTLYMTKKEQKQFILDKMKMYFETLDKAILFVEDRLLVKQKSLINRIVRLLRKARLNKFNYFVTITYDDKLHTEESFKKMVKNTLCHFHANRYWKYIYVFEKSPKGRLHIHGLFYIPDGQMVGELFEKEDYNLNTHKMQTTIQNSFFNKRFGRCDFEEIDEYSMKHDNTIRYLVKYISKTNEKIVYSRGLPCCMRSLIHEDDIACYFKDDELNRMVLFDDFNLWDFEGTCCGAVTEENKEQFGSNN